MHKSSRFALPLITRPTEHSGVTFGAATSVLLTVCEGDLSTRALQKGGEQRVSNEIDVAATERKTHPTQGFGWGTKWW